jgi:hypothetical protein
MVWDFIKGLGRQRLNALEAAAKSKAMGVVAKSKAKVAGTVNKAVDGAVKGAKDKAVGAVKKKDDKENKDMALFGKKKDGSGASAPAPEPEANFGEKTSFIQVQVERPKECVGWVVVLNGSQKGQDFRLVPGKNVLGTAADCDVVLTDQYLSNRHAVIRYEEGQFMVVDLDSTNGTYVNDERCSKEELIDNDRIRLGRTELKFKSLT